MKKLLYILPIVLLMGLKPAEDGIVISCDDKGVVINGKFIEPKGIRNQLVNIWGDADETEYDDMSFVDAYYNRGITVLYPKYNNDTVAGITIHLRDTSERMRPFKGKIFLNGEEIPFDITCKKVLKMFEFDNEEEAKEYHHDCFFYRGDKYGLHFRFINSCLEKKEPLWSLGINII